MITKPLKLVGLSCCTNRGAGPSLRNIGNCWSFPDVIIIFVFFSTLLISHNSVIWRHLLVTEKTRCSWTNSQTPMSMFAISTRDVSTQIRYWSCLFTKWKARWAFSTFLIQFYWSYLMRHPLATNCRRSSPSRTLIFLGLKYPRMEKFKHGIGENWKLSSRPTILKLDSRTSTSRRQ